MAISLGLIFLDYCKGHECYWDTLCFHNQTEDVLDCLEVLAACLAVLLEQWAQWDGGGQAYHRNHQL